jgi:hypothetical protein
MEFHEIDYTEVSPLLRDIIRVREERNQHKDDPARYEMKDAELDTLLEQLSIRFMSTPSNEMVRTIPEPLPRGEADDLPPVSGNDFDIAARIREVIPDSVNMTPAGLRTPIDTSEQRRARTQREAASVEDLENLYNSGGRRTRKRKGKRRSKRRR